jgi:hypothetical protein
VRQLNFAGAPFRNEKLPRFVYAVAVAGLIVITVIHAVTLTRYFMREQEELDVKVESLQTELNGLAAEVNRTRGELSTQVDQARNEKIQFLAALYRRRSFSWTGFFNELESLTPAPVRITSIAPGGVGPIDGKVEEELEIQIQIVARTLDDVLEMMSRLEANDLYASVLPLRESEGGQRVDGVAVTLTLNYLPQKEGTP